MCVVIDALAGYDYLINDCKIPPSRIMICGDSAGANLTLALTRYLRDEKTHPMPAALLLLSPWGDMTESHWTEGSSAQTNADTDYVSAAGFIGHTGTHEHFVQVNADLSKEAVRQFLKGHSKTRKSGCALEGGLSDIILQWYIAHTSALAADRTQTRTPSLASPRRSSMLAGPKHSSTRSSIWALSWLSQLATRMFRSTSRQTLRTMS